MDRTRPGTAYADPQIAIEETLAAATAGRHVRIEGLHAGQAANRRLAELGLRNGRVVEVLQNHREDGVIVGLGTERLALPRSLATRIRVADGSGQSSTRQTASVHPLESSEVAR